jgi:hypothetical protein
MPDFTVADLDVAARLIINVDGDSKPQVDHQRVRDDGYRVGVSHA